MLVFVILSTHFLFLGFYAEAQTRSTIDVTCQHTMNYGHRSRLIQGSILNLELTHLLPFCQGVFPFKDHISHKAAFLELNFITIVLKINWKKFAVVGQLGRYLMIKKRDGITGLWASSCTLLPLRSTNEHFGLYLYSSYRKLHFLNVEWRLKLCPICKRKNAKNSEKHRPTTRYKMAVELAATTWWPMELLGGSLCCLKRSQIHKHIRILYSIV